MKITRRHTEVGRAPYEGAALRFFSTQIDPPLSGNVADVPEAWSIEAAELLQQRCLVPGGIPARLKAIREDDVPSWLWRHTADPAALEHLPPEDRIRPESGLRAATDRIAGGWTYQGWKSGYFERVLRRDAVASLSPAPVAGDRRLAA